MSSIRSALARSAAILLLAAGAGLGAAAPASAQVSVRIGAPPPPRYEAHHFRRGYSWEPGHWDRRDGHWAWVHGYYVRIVAGRHWVPGHWAGPYGRRWIPGHWAA